MKANQTIVVAIAVAVLAGALLGFAAGNGDDETAMTSAATAPAAIGGATPAATATDPDDEPIPRREARLAAVAAERIAGGGTATDVDRSNDPGEAYEVEVATARGEVDVALDAELRRVPNRPYED
jgi:hypothetical protein